MLLHALLLSSTCSTVSCFSLPLACPLAETHNNSLATGTIGERARHYLGCTNLSWCDIYGRMCDIIVAHATHTYCGWSYATAIGKCNVDGFMRQPF